MIFKSFDRFITESNSAKLVPINESANHKFKVTNNTPESDELQNISFSAVYNMPDDVRATEEQAINVAKQYVATQLPADPAFKAGSEARSSTTKNKDGSLSPAAVIFIKVKTLRQKKIINNNVVFDADLIFKYSSNFKSADEIQKMITNYEITPYMEIPTILKSISVNIWDISQMAQLTKGSTSGTGAIATGYGGAGGTNAGIEAEKAEKARLAALAAASGGGVSGGGGGGGGSQNAGGGGTSGTSAAGGGGGVTGGFTQFTGLKQGQKSEVVRQLQKMIIAGASAYPNDPNHIKAAEAVKNSGGADANYGKKTALAIGLLTNAAGTPVTDITADVVTQLTTALASVTADQLKAVVQTTKKTNTNTTKRKKSLIKRKQSLIKKK
jgi:hypothetical protein